VVVVVGVGFGGLGWWVAVVVVGCWLVVVATTAEIVVIGTDTLLGTESLVAGTVLIGLDTGTLPAGAE
jgi:hypothetical protein